MFLRIDFPGSSRLGQYGYRKRKMPVARKYFPQEEEDEAIWVGDGVISDRRRVCEKHYRLVLFARDLIRSLAL